MDSNFYKFTKPNKKIASFDLDGTLIKPKSGKISPKDKNDYQYAFDNVSNRLNELMDDGYKIVIFTNQNGIRRGKVNLKDIIYKIEKLFPLADYFIADKDNLYRKPMPGMYEEFIKLNGTPEKIFYVGDSAGRKGDNSSVDINFAYNSGIEFKTENHFFKDIKEGLKPVSIEFFKNNKISDFKEFNNNVVVIMQGYPSSGKTSFIKNYIKHNKIKKYIHLSNDEYTKSKLIKAFKKGLEEEILIFIDNTNPTKKRREEFIKLLPDDYVAVGIHIITPMDISIQLNQARYYDSSIEDTYNCKVRTKVAKVSKVSKVSKVAKVTYNLYKKKYEKMTTSEGFYKVYSYMPDIKLKYCF
jgi:bifunctional polynucleotide phosphatase/kinase